jgi:putative transcriptional regulator
MGRNEILIKARKEKGLTQEQLAEMLNYKKSTICNWENGYSIPRLPDAFQTAKLLDKDVNYLFFSHKEQDSHTLLGPSSALQ